MEMMPILNFRTDKYILTGFIRLDIRNSLETGE
jgi:hypothetical protein